MTGCSRGGPPGGTCASETLAGASITCWPAANWRRRRRHVSCSERWARATMHRWWRRSRCNDDGRTFTPDEEIEGRDTVIMLGHVRTLCGSAAGSRRLPETSLLPGPTARELQFIGM